MVQKHDGYSSTHGSGVAHGARFAGWIACSEQPAGRDEDEFLMMLNRFNVMASRARSKLIVLVTQEVVDHLSGDLDTLRQSRCSRRTSSRPASKADR
jgi:hypothetical protein